VNDGDDLNRFLLPNVADHVRIEVPEAVPAVQQFLMKVADSWRLSQALQCLVEFRPEALRGIRTVFCYIQKNFAYIGSCFGREPKAPLYARVAFLFARLRSSIIWRSS
jgi:hypothetical protein